MMNCRAAPQQSQPCSQPAVQIQPNQPASKIPSIAKKEIPSIAMHDYDQSLHSACISSPINLRIYQCLLKLFSHVTQFFLNLGPSLHNVYTGSDATKDREPGTEILEQNVPTDKELPKGVRICKGPVPMPRIPTREKCQEHKTPLRATQRKRQRTCLSPSGCGKIFCEDCYP